MQIIHSLGKEVLKQLEVISLILNIKTEMAQKETLSSWYLKIRLTTSG